ncbi:hypothetical protein LTR94_034604, partial [Friedmanniomyces endolithicus]
RDRGGRPLGQSVRRHRRPGRRRPARHRPLGLADGRSRSRAERHGLGTAGRRPDLDLQGGGRAPVAGFRERPVRRGQRAVAVARPGEFPGQLRPADRQQGSRRPARARRSVGQSEPAVRRAVGFRR